MAYGVECTDLSFAIGKKNISKVLESLVQSKYFCLAREPEDCIEIARTGTEEEQQDLLHELLTDNGYAPEFDQNGNVADLSHQSGYWYDDNKFFEVFASYVEKGSYIQMAGEDGQLWRMLFDGEHCREVMPVISWPDCEKIEKERASENGIKSDMNILAKPLGQSTFVTWHELDTLFHKWAQAYFGEHVHGGANRDETDCEIALAGLQESDRDKFAKLFELYDTDKDFDPEEEFYTDLQGATLPDCVAAGVVGDILRGTEFGKVGHLEATYDGVFVMENSLEYADIVSGKDFVSLECTLTKKDSLADRINEAAQKSSDRTVGSPEKEPETNRSRDHDTL